MQDRIPVNPGRVMISPENGAPYYATMTRADNATQEGTPLNKNSLLKDATAALFGLGADAVPNDVFGVLSRFQSGMGNEYVWGKSCPELQYVLDATDGTSNLAITNDTKYGSKDNPPGQVTDLYTNFTYYKTLSVNKETGALSLTEQFTPTSVPTKTYSSYWGGLIPFYVKTKGGNILMVASMYSYFDDHIEFKYRWMKTSLVESNVVLGYVNSPNPNAYPVNDGYTYTALGQLGAKAQIATGSYVGTDAYGASTPNSLTFDFTPKAWGIYGGRHTTGGQVYGLGLCLLPWGKGGSNVGYHMVNSTSTTSVTMSYDGNTVSWYSTQGREQQNNHSAFEYYYIAIG